MQIRSYRKRVKLETKLFAKKLRKNQTRFEKILWEELRYKKLGVKFRRQSIILGYIVDFYCPQKRLVIEVDGSIHEKQKEYDEFRQKHIADMGFTVIRFKNEEVLYELGNVLSVIKKYL